jgi:hypothetical protein
MTLTLGSQSFQSAGLPWLIVLAMMFLGFASRGRQRLTFHLAGIAVFVVVQFSGCGSGGTTGTPPPTNFRTPRVHTRSASRLRGKVRPPQLPCSLRFNKIRAGSIGLRAAYGFTTGRALVAVVVVCFAFDRSRCERRSFSL